MFKISNKQLSRHGLFIVISGPSGSGKTSVAKALYQSDPTLIHSVSATTRSPRPNETNGVDYHFLSVAEFEALIQKDGLLEWTKYNDHYYGTLKSVIEQPIADGKNLVLEIDVDGAMQLRSLNLKGVFIFILPPSFAILEKRLRSRKTESERNLQERLRIAKQEITYVKDYDYCVINPDDGIDHAIQQIRHIISAERCRIDSQLLGSITQEFS